MAVEPPPAGLVQQIAGLGPLFGAVGTAVAAVIKAYSDVKTRNTWVFGQRRVSAKAIAAFAFGIASVPTVSGFLVASVTAVVLGEVARRDIRKANLTGKLAATIGTVAGSVGLGLAIYAVWYILVAPNWSIIGTSLRSVGGLIVVILLRRAITPVWPTQTLAADFDSDTPSGSVTRIAVGFMSGIVLGAIFTALFPISLTNINPLLPVGPLPTPSPIIPPRFPR